ncbi:hypothetical protein [Amycolatopsis anabasis]|uniref:hypothetical protein n=1 Tax=Amycolatopsis anabasis TaxID=1840409 RepID=UPI00131E56FB|nr:hypothetical protein [Amycolatopsis anabasis]
MNVVRAIPRLRSAGCSWTITAVLVAKYVLATCVIVGRRRHPARRPSAHLSHHPSPDSH